MRPYLFGTITTREMSRNGKIPLDKGGGTKPPLKLNRLSVKELSQELRICGGIRKTNYCDSSQLRGKIDGFLREGKLRIIIQNTNESRSHIGVQNLESIGLAEPGRPTARTDYDDLFLEAVTFTPKWMRSLY